MEARIELSPMQQAAVNAPWRGKKIAILATAGSGKTLVLIRRVVAIAKELVDRGQVSKPLLCVCFNESVADEMHRRIKALVLAEHLSPHVHVTSKSYTGTEVLTIEVRTFHALGLSLLIKSTVEERIMLGFNEQNIKVIVEESNELMLKALQTVGDIDKDTPPHSRIVRDRVRESLTKCQLRFNEECAAYLTGGDAPPQTAANAHLFHTYHKLLQEENGVDFQNMIRLVVILLRRSEHARQRIRMMYASTLVDECQDMSSSQLFLCKALVEHSKSLTFVGDDDQQIYSFRTGTGRFVYKMIKDLFQDITSVVLHQNYRCSGPIVKAAHAVISENTIREPKDMVAHRPDGLPVRIVQCEKDACEKHFVLREVKALLPKVREQGGRILLLFRRNNMLETFREFFKENQVSTTTTKVLARKEKHSASAPRTAKMFALLDLMSPETAQGRFLLAARTICPTLDKEELERIVLDKDLDEQAKYCEGGAAHEVERHLETTRLSPFLLRLRAWYLQPVESRGASNAPLVEGLRFLFMHTDKLLLEMKAVRSMTQLVKCVDAVLSSDICGGNERPPSHISLMGDYLPKGVFDGDDDSNTDNAAYTILMTEAEKLDTRISKRMGSASEKAPHGHCEEACTCIPSDSRGNNSSQHSCAQDFSRAAKRTRREGISYSSDIRVGMAPYARFFLTYVEELRQRVADMLEDVDGDCLLLEETPLVVLSTVHSAKGTTFSYVFLCGANDQNFPFRGRAIAREEGKSLEQILKLPLFQEERRLIFVALTRAVIECTFTYSQEAIWNGRRYAKKPSPFITELLRGLKSDPKYVRKSNFPDRKEEMKRQRVWKNFLP